MGYGIMQGKTSFCILFENCDAAFSALKSLLSRHDLMTGGSRANDLIKDRWFAFTYRKDMEYAASLDWLMATWRWPIARNIIGDVVGVTFTGENLGDEDVLWSTLAPFVEDGCRIQIFGEDGDSWVWEFSDRCVAAVG